MMPPSPGHTRRSGIGETGLQDADGIADTYAVFTGSDVAAHAILEAPRRDYLMACSAAPDWSFYIAEAPQGLLARLASGHGPDWLVPAVHAGDVSVWRVR